MTTESVAIVEREERFASRVPHKGTVAYRCTEEDAGIATWCSVGTDGACIRMGHYLCPGRHLILMAGQGSSGPVEMSGRVVWCRPTAEGRTFVAGLRIFNDDHSAAEALASIVRRARAEVQEVFSEWVKS